MRGAAAPRQLASGGRCAAPPADRPSAAVRASGSRPLLPSRAMHMCATSDDLPPKSTHEPSATPVSFQLQPLVTPVCAHQPCTPSTCLSAVKQSACISYARRPPPAQFFSRPQAPTRAPRAAPTLAAGAAARRRRPPPPSHGRRPRPPPAGTSHVVGAGSSLEQLVGQTHGQGRGRTAGWCWATLACLLAGCVHVPEEWVLPAVERGRPVPAGRGVGRGAGMQM